MADDGAFTVPGRQPPSALHVDFLVYIKHNLIETSDCTPCPAPLGLDYQSCL
jgi:hypothetical protein